MKRPTRPPRHRPTAPNPDAEALSLADACRVFADAGALLLDAITPCAVPIFQEHGVQSSSDRRTAQHEILLVAALTTTLAHDRLMALRLLDLASRTVRARRENLPSNGHDTLHHDLRFLSKLLLEKTG